MVGKAPLRRRLRRSLVAAIAAPVLATASLATVLASPAGAFSGAFPNWMIRSTAVSLIDGYVGNDALTTSAFDNPTTVETSAPHDWMSQDVQTYDAYGPSTAPGSLLYALDNGKVPLGATYLLYDDESWSATPLAEQQDPAYYMSLFVTAAHEAGYGAILAPAVDLTTSMPCYKSADADWANYLDDCDIPQIAAEAQPDVYEVQSQRFEDDTSSGANCDCFAWIVDSAAEQVGAVDPFVAVYAGISTDHSGIVSTPQNLYTDTLATENQVAGYWLNVPQQSGACPSCTPGGAPQVAAQYLWLLGYQGAGDQTISFTAPTGATVGASATLAATGGPSGNPVVFSVDQSSTPGSCSVSGATLTYAGAGSCVVDADQAGTTDWNAATEVQRTVTVAPGAQAISLTPPAAAEVGGTATLQGSGGATGNPVVFSVDPATAAGVCSVSGADGTAVSYDATGACVIDANEAGDADWNAAPQVVTTIGVGAGNQSIALTQPAAAAVGGSATLQGSGGASGNPVVFSLDPATTAGVCSVSDGTTVSYGAAGVCVIDANEAGDVDWNPAPQDTETIEVTPGSQTIQFGNAGGNGQVGQLPTGTVGTSVTLVATGGPSTSPVVFSVDPSTAAGVCSVSGTDGATLSFGAVGPCVVDANQAGDANYLPASEVQATIAVGPGAQSIAFSPPASAAVGASFTLSAAGGPSTSPVLFSVDPATAAGVCSVSGLDGTTVTFTGVGACTLDADQAADANWNAAPQVVQTIVVVQGAQALTFSAPPAAVYGTSVTLAAGGGPSGNPVVFSVDSSSTAGACQVSGSVLDLTGVGSCVVDANQAGDSAWAAAPQVSATITVAPATQTISLGSPPAAAAGESVQLTATGGGGTSPVVFSVDPSTTAGVCSITGATVSFAAVGACTLDANQAGDADHLPAPQVSETIAVAPGSQTITLATWPAGNVGSSAPLSASGGGSTSPVVFSVDPSTAAGVCSVAGATVTFAAVGACVIDANQAADANYLAAPTATETITVLPGLQTVSFTAPASGVVGTGTVLAGSGGPSGNPVVFSVDSSSGAGVCSVSGPDGTALSYSAAGTCVIDANQAGSGNWLAAPEAVESVTVAPGSQSVSFSPPSSGVFGTTVSLSATGGPSGNAVVFSVAPSSGAGVCSVSGTHGAALSLTGAGTCVIDANEAGNANWLAAPQVSASLTVTPATQAITVTSSAPASAVYGGPTYSVTATGGGSGNAVVFTSATTSVCTVAGDSVSFPGVGTCTVLADQQGNVDYSAAPEVSQSFHVGRASQVITFTSTAPASATYAGAAYTVAAVGGPSGRPVTFTSATATVCAVSGSSVTFVGVGTCTVDANQMGTTDYAPAAQAAQSFAVAPANQEVEITSTAPSDAVYAGPTYTVSATGGASGNPVTFSSGRTTVCTVSGDTVSFVGVGTCPVVAAQAGDADYAAATPVTQSFVVYKSGQSFVITSKPPSKPTVGGKYTMTSTTGASGVAVVYTSATTTVCTVSGAVVTLVKAGTCTIDANEGSNTDYYAAPEQSQTFTVAK